MTELVVLETEFCNHLLLQRGLICRLGQSGPIFLPPECLEEAGAVEYGLQCFLQGGGSSMGGATTSTPGVRSPRRLTFLWESRYRESEVLLRCLLSLRLLLTRLRLGLSGRRRRNRFTLNGYGGISYKELLVLVSVLLTDRCHLSIEQELRGE